MIEKMVQKLEIVPGLLDHIVDGVDRPEWTRSIMYCAYGTFAPDEDTRPIYQRRVVCPYPAVGSVNIDIPRLSIFLS